MPGVDFAMVRSRISLAQVLDLVGFIPIRRAGPQLRGPCPVRQCVSSDQRRFSDDGEAATRFAGTEKEKRKCTLDCNYACG
jgi:hypothetical protein